MKIDLHHHTLKTKSGEYKLDRELDINDAELLKNFKQELLDNHVKILAITNHNIFDLKQFKYLKEYLKEDCLVLPGIEIDVFDPNSKKRKKLNMNIIISDEQLMEFDKIITNLSINNPNSFEISIIELFKILKSFKKICLLPNYQKGGIDLEKETVDFIFANYNNENTICVFETSNKDSAIILNNNGHPALCGTDNKTILDVNYSKLPDIRIFINSFDKLLMFFKKNENFITNEIKKKETYKLILDLPWNQKIDFEVYNDINVIIGGKGTGKTDILEAICNKLEKDYNLIIEQYDGSNINNTFDQLINSSKKTILNNEIKVDSIIDELKKIIMGKDFDYSKCFINYKAIYEYGLGDLSSYKNILEITLNSDRDIFLLDNIDYKTQKDQEFKQIKEHILKTIKILEDNIINSDKHNFVIDYLQLVLNNIIEKLLNEYKKYYSINLANNWIKTYKLVLKEQKNKSSLPTNLGLLGEYKERKAIKSLIKQILIINNCEYGNEPLGKIDENTKIFHKIRYNLKPKAKAKMNINSLDKLIWKADLTSKIKEARELIKENKFTTDNIFDIKDKYLDNNFIEYNNISSGQKSVLALSNYLEKERELYILDEPEKSLDNFFINKYILEKFKKILQNNKTIILVTHNANLAIRTYPLNIIYRDKSHPDCNTFYGNIFINNFINTNINLFKVSQDLLEGGQEAMLERNNIYCSGKECKSE